MMGNQRAAHPKALMPTTSRVRSPRCRHKLTISPEVAALSRRCTSLPAARFMSPAYLSKLHTHAGSAVQVLDGWCEEFWQLLDAVG